MIQRIKFRLASARCDAVRQNDEIWDIRNLYSGNPGCGEARELMYTVCDWADGNKLHLTLRALPNTVRRDTDLRQEELARFYEKFGFVRTVSTMRQTTMIRSWVQ